MKKLLAVIFAGILTVQAGGIVFAAEDKDEGKWQDNKKIVKMTKDYDLTGEQKEKVSVIMKETVDKIKAEKQKFQETTKAIKAGEEQKIKAVLTPEQSQKYEKKRAENKEKMEKMRKKIKKNTVKEKE